MLKDVKQLQEGSPFALPCRLIRKERKADKNGNPYYILNIQDKSDKAGVVVFSNAEAKPGMAVLPLGSVVILTGTVSFYKDKFSPNIRTVTQLMDADPASFAPESRVDADELGCQLSALMQQIEQDRLIRLVEFVLDAYPTFYTTAAGLRIHHAYAHGLLEHSINVTRTALKIADNYPGVNMDILIVGALLHDIGKAIEYKIENDVVTITKEGNLLGHIPIGARIIQFSGERVGVDEETLLQLIHIVLSHHGELEYGAQVTPATKEAIIINTADALDAKLNAFDCREFDLAGFSEYNPTWKTKFYKPVN